MLLQHILFLLLHLLASSDVVAARRPSNAILLSTVKSLTVRGDKVTTARRVKAIPQLKCIGGSAKGLYDVDVMRCKNSGSEYSSEDIAWTCQASLPSEFKLGSTEVICEGYDSADDEYVLKGSCGVEYRLVLTELGEQKYGSRKQSWFKSSNKSDEPEMNSFFTAIFWLVFLGIVGFMLCKILFPDPAQRHRPNNMFRGFGGGGHDDGNDPPPPYSRRPPPRPKPSQPQSNAWRPGFWSGTAAGAAAGYAMGSRNNRAAPAQAGPSNWFNTGARNNQQNTFGGGWDRQVLLHHHQLDPASQVVLDMIALALAVLDGDDRYFLNRAVQTLVVPRFDCSSHFAPFLICDKSCINKATLKLRR
ncbi:hypothetical protein MRB53_037965 [Persea americana]|nr:hypothetical protein MRB53_037965 [Persea americana]